MSELHTCCGKVLALAPIIAIGALRDNGLYEDTHLAFQVHVSGLEHGLWFQSQDDTDAGRAALERERECLIRSLRQHHRIGVVAAGLFEVAGLLLSLQAISAITPLYSQTLPISGWGGITRHNPLYDIHVAGLKEPLRRQATVACPVEVLRAERDALLEAWADWIDPKAALRAV